MEDENTPKPKTGRKPKTVNQNELPDNIPAHALTAREQLMIQWPGNWEHREE